MYYLFCVLGSLQLEYEVIWLFWIGAGGLEKEYYLPLGGGFWQVSGTITKRHAPPVVLAFSPCACLCIFSAGSNLSSFKAHSGVHF